MKLILPSPYDHKFYFSSTHRDNVFINWFDIYGTPYEVDHTDLLYTPGGWNKLPIERARGAFEKTTN